MGSVPLKRVGAIGRATMILVGVAAVASVAGYLAGLAVVDDANDYLDGSMSLSDFQTAIVPYSLISLIQGAATIAAAVLVMIWMYRLAANHRTLQRTGAWGPGWAIGGWFLPPLLYVIPFLMMRELWKASDPDVPIGGEWKSRAVSPLVVAWFVVYSPVSAVVQFASTSTSFNLGSSEGALAEQIADNETALGLTALVTVVAGGLFVAMAKQLTDRHRRLIGER